MAQWFQNQEISLAIGLCISIPKIGNALNSLITPRIYTKYDSLAAPMIVGVGTLIFSFVLLYTMLGLCHGINLHGLEK
jgi:Sec-independent protein secretion pathway component TatC